MHRYKGIPYLLIALHRAKKTRYAQTSFSLNPMKHDFINPLEATRAGFYLKEYRMFGFDIGLKD